MLTKHLAKQRDPFCFVTRLLSGSLSLQGTNSYARNLGWPTPYPFSSPSRVLQSRQAGGGEFILTYGLHPRVFRICLSPQDKTQGSKNIRALYCQHYSLCHNHAFPRYQDASLRAKLVLNPGGGKGISEKEEISGEAPRPRKCQARAQLQAAGTCTSSVAGYVRNAQKEASCRFKSSVPALRRTDSDSGCLFISPNVPDFFIALLLYQSRQPYTFLSCRLEVPVWNILPPLFVWLTPLHSSGFKGHLLQEAFSVTQCPHP